MAEYYPSEIARLVLGYLKEANCPKAWEKFLVESIDLQEHYQLLQSGKPCSTNIEGKSLLEILREYCHFKDAAERNTRKEINSSFAILNVSCADPKSSDINPNACSSESFKTLKRNNVKAFYNSEVHQARQSQATVHFAQGRNRSPWSVQTHRLPSNRSLFSRRPSHLKRVCAKALNFGTVAERNEKPISAHSAVFKPPSKHTSARQSVRETIGSQRFCHSNLLERKTTMLSKMVQTETSQVIVDNRSCLIASDSPSHKRLLKNSSNEYPHWLTTSVNSTNCSVKDELQSNTEYQNFSNESNTREKLDNSKSSFSENETSANNVVVYETTVSTSSANNFVVNETTVSTSSANNVVVNETTVSTSSANNVVVNEATVSTSSANNDVVNETTVSTSFANNVVVNETTVSTSSANNVVVNEATVSTSSANNIVVNETTVSTSNEIRTTGGNESSATPSCDTEPPLYSRAPSSNSPRLILSFNRTQVSSLTTPMKDRKQWIEEYASPTVKDTVQRSLLSEFPRLKEINSNESSFVAIQENVEAVFEEDTANQPIVQRLADITTVIVEDPGASNSSSFPTMLDIQNSDIALQNILAGEESVSLFSDFSLYANSRDCDNLNTQEPAIETSKRALLTTEDTETNKDKCEHVDNKAMTLKLETDSSKQHDNTEEKSNQQNSMNEIYSPLPPSAQGNPLDSESAVGQNTPTAVNVEVSEKMELVGDKTNLPLVSSSNGVLGTCMSVIQPDAADNIIDMQSTSSNINESPTLVSTYVAENITGIDDVSTLKPVSIGTPFQIGTQIVSQAACSIKQSIPTTQTSVCCPTSSVTDSTTSFIPSNRNISVLPAVPDQRFILNSNFQISPITQFSYPSAPGFSLQPLNGFQSKFIIIQQPCPSHSMNATNWTNNNLRNDISVPVQTMSAENITESTIINSSSIKVLNDYSQSKSFLANDVNFATVTFETTRPKKKAKNSLDEKKRRKLPNKKTTYLKQKMSCKSPCSSLKSAECAYGKKKRFNKCITKEKVDETSDFVTNAIEKLTARKAVSSSMSDVVLNAVQDVLQSKSVKRKTQNSSAVYDLSQKTETSSSPIKKAPLKCSSSGNRTVIQTGQFIPKSSFYCDSESDNIPLSLIASKLKGIKETEIFAHKQNNPQKSDLEKETDKNIKEKIFPSTNTGSIKSSASNNIKPKDLNHFQQETSKVSKKIRNAKSTQLYNFSEVTGNSPSNPIVLGSDEDIDMSEKENENVTSHVMCNIKSKSSKKEQKKKYKKKHCLKLTSPSKEKSLSHKNSKKKNSSLSQISNLPEICKTNDNLLQNDNSISLTEKSNYKILQESCNEKEILCNKRSMTESSDTSRKKLLKEHISLNYNADMNESNNYPLSNEETDFLPPKNECKTSQNSVMEKKQESEQKGKWYISPQNDKEVHQPSSYKNSQHSLRTKKSRNIDELCDKLKLNAVQSSSSKEETLTKADTLPSTIVRNSFEIPANETSLQHESLPSETIVSVNSTENETVRLSSIKFFGEEKSMINTEVRNNITLDFETSINFKQSSIGDQSNVRRLVLPPKKRIRPVSVASPCDSSFSPLSSPVHTVGFDSTSRPIEVPPLARNTSNAEMNEIFSSPPKLTSPAHAVCFDYFSKPKEMPSLSPIDVDAVKKCSSGKSKAATEFFKSAFSDRESNLPISLDSKPSSLCIVDAYPRNDLPPADTLKTSPGKENCPVNILSTEMKETEIGQKRKPSSNSIKNSPGEILLPLSCSSQVQLKNKRPKFRMKRNVLTQLIPAGVKIPTKWSKSKIQCYSNIISKAEDEVGSKVPRRSRPNIKAMGSKSLLKRKSKCPLDLSKQTKSS